MYALKFTRQGLGDVRALAKNIRGPLRNVLKQKLAVDPKGCSSELREPLQGFRSLHWKQYRVVFKIYEDYKIVAIAGVGERSAHSRSSVYRRLETLVARGRLAEELLSTLRGFSSEI